MRETENNPVKDSGSRKKGYRMEILEPGQVIIRDRGLERPSVAALCAFRRGEN